MPSAVLDTCVLYSGLRRDFLLSLVAEGVYRLVLTNDLLWEVEYVEARKLQRCGLRTVDAELRARRLTEAIRSAFDVVPERRLHPVRPVGLPDQDDEHVVAAALVGPAEVIVTENVKHFPGKLLPDGIRVQHPTSFLDDMVTARPARASSALSEMSARRRKPPQSERDLIDLMMMKNHMRPQTAEVLRRALEATR